MAPRNFTDSEEEQIARIYSSGKSAKSIMRAYGLKHHESIMGALRRQGIEQRPVPERNRLHKLNPYIFDSLDNEVSAYLHGFIYADGHVSQDKTLIIALSPRDREHLEKIRILLETESAIKFRPKAGGYGTDAVRLEVTDRHLAAQLKQKGISTGRLFPKLAFDSVPDDMFNHWLRGFFDGDGSARKSKSLVFCGKYEFMFLLREKISSYCQVNPNLAITKHSTKALYYTYYSGRIVALRVADFIYKDATIWLERKRNVIESWPLPQSRKKG